MATFKLIHISDLHFASDAPHANMLAFRDLSQEWTRREFLRAPARLHMQGTHNPDIARKVAKCLLVNAKDQSLLVISGDMAATGLADDLDAALRFLEGTPHRLVPFQTKRGEATLAAGRFEVLLVPGNHDRFADHRGTAGGTVFDVHFSRYWNGSGSLVKRKVLQHPASEDRLALIAADCCLTCNADALEPIFVNHYGQGRVTDRVIKALVSETTEVRRAYPGVGVCWVVHFPTTLVGSAQGPSMALVDSHLMTQAAADAGVELTLSGHFHESLLLQDGGLTLCCAGSATYYKEAHGNFLHLLEIEAGEGRATLSRRRDFQWDADAEEFIERSDDGWRQAIGPATPSPAPNGNGLADRRGSVDASSRSRLG